MSSSVPPSGKKTSRAPAQGEARKGVSRERSRVVPSNALVIRDAVPVSSRPPSQGMEENSGAPSYSAMEASNRRGLVQDRPAEPPLSDDKILTFYRLASKTPRLKKRDLKTLSKFYHFHEDVAAILPRAKDSYVTPSPFWVVNAEMLRMGLRLPASVFVSSFLKAINRAPHQLMPWGWFCLTAFQVACSRANIIPTVDLFLFLFVVEFKGAAVSIYSQPGRKFTEGSPPKHNKSRWFDTWFLVLEG